MVDASALRGDPSSPWAPRLRPLVQFRTLLQCVFHPLSRGRVPLHGRPSADVASFLPSVKSCLCPRSPLLPSSSPCVLLIGLSVPALERELLLRARGLHPDGLQWGLVYPYLLKETEKSTKALGFARSMPSPWAKCMCLTPREAAFGLCSTLKAFES